MVTEEHENTSVAADLAPLKGLVDCLAEGEIGLSLRTIEELFPLEFAWSRVLMGGISSLAGSSTSCSRGYRVRRRTATEHVAYRVSYCMPDGKSCCCRSHLRGGSAHGSCRCSRCLSGHRTRDGTGTHGGRGLGR
ncbi:hypothetical protein PMAYCL1PPCAC_00717, partial [Pristionchus mayeri]